MYHTDICYETHSYSANGPMFVWQACTSQSPKQYTVVFMRLYSCLDVSWHRKMLQDQYEVLMMSTYVPYQQVFNTNHLYTTPVFAPPLRWT